MGRPARVRSIKGSVTALALSSIAALTLSACTASSGTGGSSTTAASQGSSTPVSGDSGSHGGSSGAATSLQQQYESVITAVLPSTVEIRTDSGLGSGIVFDKKGDIVTNDHVVGNAKKFKVRLASSAKPLDGTLVGTFQPNDLAVIKVSGASHLRPAHFANSAKVRVGQIVLAMGNPLGLSSSVTEGIVSAVGRTLTEPKSEESPGATLPDSIQTSAAINPGNSGGALVNLDDDVVGIPTLAAVSQQEGGAAPGIGFAIPSNTVTLIAKQLIKNGKVTKSGRAALGVGVASVTDQTGAPAGAAVETVQSGGGAAKAGIRAGDVIVKVDGDAVHSTEELSTILAGLKVGQKVPVTVIRGGTTKKVQVTLGQLKSG